MFGKEKYSRDNYQEAQKAVDVQQENYMESGTPIPSRGYDPNYEGMLANIREAKERLEQLKAQGHKEARDLNELYDKLKSQAEHAVRALFDFERDKLGMHERNK
jgi:hypothetical protein